VQLALFQRPLFEDDILNRRRTEWLNEPVSGFDKSANGIRQFCREIRGSRGKVKETALEQAFNQAFFVSLLGYQLYPGVEGSWTAWPKPPSSATKLNGEPDLLLGTVGPEGFEILAVVELKKPGTALEAPQPSYDNRSPVEQAFDYAQNLASCRWVIVSDMRFVRLYAVDTADEYHEIDLQADVPDATGGVHEAYRLLAYDFLVVGGADSATSRLLAAARDLQAAFRDGFYRLYSDIRSDLLVHIEAWSAGRFSRTEQVLAVQRLLDRLLFIFFCEDHPDRLLRNDMVKGVTDRAVLMPGPSTTKAYDQLKALFHDLDVGANTKTWQVPRYNGELFKPHPIVDNLSLPDSLYERRYSWTSPSGAQRVVNGAYGLHVFDFWRELDRDLLGNLFERSIGDLTALAHGGRPDARQAFGIFYTASRLARFVATSAVQAMLAENTQLASALTRAATAGNDGGQSTIDEIVELLKQYRIADLACGSGVFLTAAMNVLLAPYRKAVEAVASGGLVSQLLSMKQAEVLKSSIYGADLLPQAVELAKLALWLTAARRNEPSADLTSNFAVGNSLSASNIESLLKNAGGKFDLILGNPPWGGEFNRDEARHVLRDLGLQMDGSWDSWEVSSR